MAKIRRRQFIQGAAALGAAAATGLPTPAAAGDEPGPPPAGATVKQPVTTNTPPGTEKFFDPYYNVVRGRVPRSYHPWVANREDRVLLYTRTAGPRPPPLGPALPAGMTPPLTPAHVLQKALIGWLGA